MTVRRHPNAREGATLRERLCPVCETRYLAATRRLRFGRQTTCSRECSYRWRGEKAKTSVTCECGTCGAEFERVPSQLKRVRHDIVYCSPDCMYEGRSQGLTPRIVEEPYEYSEEGLEAQRQNGRRLAHWLHHVCEYSHSEKTKQKLREAAIQAIQEGRIPSVSSLEDMVAECLDDLGVVYKRQWAIRDPRTGRYKAVCDFRLLNLDRKVVLEVNGTYWHSDPRVYSRPRTKSQLRTHRAYRRKMSLLKEKEIEVIEVWEKDLKERGGSAVAEAVSQVIPRGGSHE